MTPERRLAFVIGFLALTLLSASSTLALARVATADSAAEPRAAVAGAHKTIVRSTPAAKPATTARRTVLRFLDALRTGDYARACDQLLNAAGCERDLAATRAGVSEFRVVTAKVRGTNAVVEAVADGIATRFTLLRRNTRWWIATLDVER